MKYLTIILVIICASLGFNIKYEWMKNKELRVLHSEFVKYYATQLYSDTEELLRSIEVQSSCCFEYSFVYEQASKLEKLVRNCKYNEDLNIKDKRAIIREVQCYKELTGYNNNSDSLHLVTGLDFLEKVNHLFRNTQLNHYNSGIAYSIIESEPMKFKMIGHYNGESDCYLNGRKLNYSKNGIYFVKKNVFKRYNNRIKCILKNKVLRHSQEYTYNF